MPISYQGKVRNRLIHQKAERGLLNHGALTVT